MRYFKKLQGGRIYLSPINPDDLEIYTKWINDPEVSLWIGLHARLISLPKERDTLERMAKNDDDFIFAIVANDGDRLLGNIGLHQISRNYRHATLGIFLGEAEDRSKGYGAEAIRLLLGYAFKTLNLHSVELTVNSTNARAIACYKKAGFKESGRVREAVYADGAYADRVHMDILESEY